MKQSIKLTESELRKIIMENVEEALNEIQGKTHGRLRKASQQAKHDDLHNIPSTNIKKTNFDKVCQAQSLSNDAANSLIAPFKTIYKFYGDDLTGVPGILGFQLELLYELNDRKALLKGKLVFKDKTINGLVGVNMNTHETFYQKNEKSKRFHIDIIPSDTHNLATWNNLLAELDKSNYYSQS